MFFRSNYNSAEKTNTGLLMLAVMSVFVIDRRGIRLDEMVVDPVVLIAGLVICLLIYTASIFSSICCQPFTTKACRDAKNNSI